MFLRNRNPIRFRRFRSASFLPLLGPVVGGILLGGSFPSAGMSTLAWIALIPLLLSIVGKSLVHGFLLSLACGAVFFPIIFSWILEVWGYTYLHHAILAVYLGSYFGIFGLAFSFISRRSGPATALFVAPFVWVSLEYIRSNFFFLALPWGLLGHSQYQHPLIIGADGYPRRRRSVNQVGDCLRRHHIMVDTLFLSSGPGIKQKHQGKYDGAQDSGRCRGVIRAEHYPFLQSRSSVMSGRGLPVGLS